ncbi:MAG: homoserine dehydrogenase [Flavobacteriales bacterium]|nr:homoserine dehydrogenase [Flavobacteriales bacterium]
MSTLNKLKLYGFGVVGQGFQEYLAQNENPKRLHTIIVKDAGKSRKKVDSIIETTNPYTIRDREVFAIIELISSVQDAYGLVFENLEIGKNVISANKKLIAENLDLFIRTERSSGSTFLYEGAVCGSIPIIRILNDLFAYEELRRVKGIFNGSSNYILSKLFQDDLSYEEALNQAQELGFAEADPTSDVGGYDSLYKLIIATVHAFGVIIRPEQVLNVGIDAITKEDVEFAKQYGLKIKLIARASRENGALSLSVLPTLLDASSELFNIENEYNGVVVEGESIGTHFYKGKGAGSHPTGAVVYADLKALDAGYRYSYHKLDQAGDVFIDDEEVTVLFSAETPFSINKLEVEFSNLIPLDAVGKRHLAKIKLSELRNNKHDIQNKGISVLAVDTDVIAKQLIQSYRTTEILA